MRLTQRIGGRPKPATPSIDRMRGLLDARGRLESQLALLPKGDAAIVLHPVQNGGFDEIVDTAKAALEEKAPAADTVVESSNDPYAFRWLILRNSSFDELVESMHAISAELEPKWWSKLLCAVFAFGDESGRRVYWVYNYKWGVFYPIAPATENQHRDVERERILVAQLEPEVTIEPELGVWFPLWGIPL